MITVTGNRISIPQGESGVVTFCFKDLYTNAPFIISNPSLKHKIKFVVKSGVVNNDASNIIEKEFEIDNGDLPEDSDDWTVYEKGWYVFDSSTIETIECENATVSADELADSNKLYKAVLNDVNKSIHYVFRITDKVFEYDYDNSSIPIVFNREDTADEAAKTYYFEISHIALDSEDNIVIKETLIPPTEFIITGALI